MKTTYNDIFLRNQILANIPNQMEERRLSAGTSTSLLLMRIAYQKKIDEFEETTRKALDEIKKEERFKDFDRMADEHSRMEDVFARKKAHDEWDGKGEQPAVPSDEELAKANETKEKEPEYRALLDELMKAYNEVRIKQAAIETTIEIQALSRAELEDIVGTIGTEGTISVSTPSGEAEELRMTFLAMVANYFA